MGRRIGGRWLFCTELGHQLEIPPDIVGQHENLKVGVSVFKFGRRDSVPALSFGLRDLVFNVSPCVLFYG